ncbi:hypothetical protein NDU88_010973 [Pleurodeles waltl]|uniref:Uncharacterized protein n=1 Tax=Pleurodeles waltl TaxID=8319 RepID=A0AAV7QW80_PLEWA|nr:hypothetical protein NDU88_010973 [Pleurodeles waltl]
MSTCQFMLQRCAKALRHMGLHTGDEDTPSSMRYHRTATRIRTHCYAYLYWLPPRPQAGPACPAWLCRTGAVTPAERGKQPVSTECPTSRIYASPGAPVRQLAPPVSSPSRTMDCRNCPSSPATPGPSTPAPQCVTLVAEGVKREREQKN